MDCTEDYDTLLRSIFESCDSTGSGFISTSDFKKLCCQLSLQTEYTMLYEYLFRSETRISYDSFRDGLLQLLAGTLQSDTEESDTGITTEKCDKPSSDVAPQARDDGDLNDNDVSMDQIRCESFSDKPKEDEDEERIRSNDWLVIDILEKEGSKNKYSGSNNDHSVAAERPIYTGRKSHSQKPRRYGRRSLPENDLIVIDDRHSTSNPAYNENNRSSAGMAGNREPAREESLFDTSRIVVEELVGEGDGSNWTNPDTDMIQTQHSASDDEIAVGQSAASDAQEALGAIWQEVIGDLSTSINIEQLQKLYHALSLTSSGGDVKQLFEMLDSDGDGLISYGDFARQMSIFLNANDSEVDEVGNSNVNSRRNSVFGDDTGSQSRGRKSLPRTPSAATNVLSVNIPVADNSLTPSGHITLHETAKEQQSVSRSLEHVGHQARPSSTNCDADSNSVSSPVNGGYFYTPPSFKTADYDSSLPMADRQSLEVKADGSQMMNYEGVPKYRRRRKSNSNASRSRRRMNKTVALPHYHPISRRRLQESPLYFLTGENERYVDIEKLQNIWSEDGIEDTDQVLKDLGVHCDDSFSVEILSEAMETEIKDNLLHHAICSVYKSGITFYRSQKEHEQCERSKFESRVDHLTSQLQEHDEKCDKMECEFQSRLEQVETEYKSQITRLTKDLTTAQSKLDLQNEFEISRLRHRVEELSETENLLRYELNELVEEHRLLQQQHAKAVFQLQASESNMTGMRSDFERVCQRMVECNRQQQEQNSRMEALLLQYQNNSSKHRDETDELFNDVDQMKRKWWSQCSVLSSESIATNASKSVLSSESHNNSATSDLAVSARCLESGAYSSPATTSSSNAPKRNYTSRFDASTLWKLSNDPDASMSEMANVVMASKPFGSKSLFSELGSSSPGVA